MCSHSRKCKNNYRQMPGKMIKITNQCIGLLLLFLFINGVPTTGRAVVSNTGYIEYRPGTVNVILAAPHGGDLRPPEIPARPPFGCYIDDACVYRPDCGEEDLRCPTTSVKDMYTKEQTEEMEAEIQRVMGGSPHVVVNLLHRSRLDANRDIGEAAYGNPVAEEAWREFQGAINQSKVAIGGRGIFLDIHGHGHIEPWVELGYLHRGTDLDLGNVSPETGSIRSIAEHVGGQGTSYEEILRGASSFGGCLNDRGYVAVPSPNNPSPEGGNYFSGGYNTRMHGSRDGGLIDGIQIESPRFLRELPDRLSYGENLVTCIQRFLNDHYPSTK